MKKLLLFLLFFSATLSFVKSYDFKENKSKNDVLEVEIIHYNDEFIHLINDYKKTKENSKLLEYINKSGFYNCNVFKSLEKNKINNFFLNSCIKLLIDYKKTEALKNFENSNLIFPSEDIYNSYLGLLYSLNGNKKDTIKYINLLENKDDLKIFIEYLKFSSGNNYNEYLLLKEIYAFKDYFLHVYLKNKRDESNFEGSVELSKEALSYENKYFDKTRYVYFKSLHQYIYSHLYDYHFSRSEYIEAGLNYIKIYEYYSENDTEEKNYFYNEVYLPFILTGDYFDSKLIKSEEYKKLLSILSTNDKKVIELYIEMLSLVEKREKITEISKIEEYFNAFYCSEISNAIKNKSKFHSIKQLVSFMSYEDAKTMNICENAKKEIGDLMFLKNKENDILKINKTIQEFDNSIEEIEDIDKGDKKSTNIFIIFIGILVLFTLLLFIISRKKNV